MSWDINPLLILVIIAAGWLFFSIRVAKENERFAVFAMGQYRKLVGPGLLIKWSGAMKWHRLRLGDIGVWVGDDMAQFGAAVVPVTYATRPSHGVRIERFEDNVVVAPFENRSVVCEKCGHVNHVSA